LLIIIFLAIFGDLMSWGNSWTTTGFFLTKANFARYFDELIHFSFVDLRHVLRPGSAYYVLDGTHYHFLVIHVLLANLFLIILPFSKIVHSFLSVPINLLRRK
jgi:nitrate reductase gamma subunit